MVLSLTSHEEIVPGCSGSEAMKFYKKNQSYTIINIFSHSSAQVGATREKTIFSGATKHQILQFSTYRGHQIITGYFVDKGSTF